MKHVLEIGTAKAEPGTKANGAIIAGQHPAGSNLEMPVIVINGAEDGPVLWLNACIHGDEPQGPLSMVFLMRELDPKKLRGAVVCVPAMNVPAFEAGKRGNPLDMFSYDMNRVYPGSPDGRFTERIAWAHREALVANADMEISVHSGGDHSFLDKTIFRAHTDESTELAQAMGKGWKLLLSSPHPKGSPMAELFEQGKAAISIELGGYCHTMPDDFRQDGRDLADSFWNVLYHYDMVDGTPEYEDKWLTGTQQAVLANHSGLWVAEEGFEFLTPAKGGDVFARIYSVYGDELEQIKAPCDGMAFGLRTTPSTHAGDWGIFYAILDGELNELVHGPHKK
ncbi:MAG: succinylglutamate desuccinylase/aspartoacylase family protein [Anaerolineaceae bacterium]|nr:succinylglutamate desuccinylase/aspartoacylase family protein [Anaerolineaceae bacterium]